MVGHDDNGIPTVSLNAKPLPPDDEMGPLAPRPEPLAAPLGTFALLRALRANPVATWTRLHFEKQVIGGTGVLGRVLVVHDPALVRHVLVDNAANYPKDDLQRRVLSSGLGKGLLMAEGDMWRAQRRALAPLFSPRTVAGFGNAMADVAVEVAARIGRSREGRTLEIGNAMAQAGLAVLARTIFSDGLTRTPAEFAHAVTAYLGAVGKLDPLDILDVPSVVPRLGRLRARPALRFFDAAVEAMITRRRDLVAKGDGTAPKDLLTLLLQARDPETGAGLDDVEVRANIVTFIAAGHETTANALTWALYLLSQDPAARARVEHEADRELPDGRLDPARIDALVETRAVLDETLRLYPPAATISRQALGPDRVNGLLIKAGTQIVISPFVLGRHKTLWRNPDHFQPERFLPEARRSVDRFAYLPFGAGPRVCIGASFALQEAVTILATLVRRVRLDLRPGHPVMPVQRITLRPQDGMPMTVTRRGLMGEASASPTVTHLA